MKVLIACEESQEVCTAFRAQGHEAYSCDLIEPSGGHPEWHILGDALKALEGGQVVTMDGVTHDIGKWDLLIAHPPCTYLSNAGASRLYKIIDGKSYVALERLSKGMEAKDFFLRFLQSGIPKIAVENPVPSGVYRLPSYTQIIQPWQFGHPFHKKTCLWLKGLPPLEPTEIVVPTMYWVQGQGQRGKGHPGGHRSQKERSKTFPGIAKAMAEQWG